MPTIPIGSTTNLMASISEELTESIQMEVVGTGQTPERKAAPKVLPKKKPVVKKAKKHAKD